MGLFGQLLDQDGSVPPTPEAAGQVGYDPRLRDTLLHDHAELGRLYGRIGSAEKAGNFDEMRLLLATFKSRLEAHLLTENLRFYNYLEQAFEDAPDILRMVVGFRQEMDDIAHDVIAFIKTYQASNWEPRDCHQFKCDYETIGMRLEHRLNCEEDSLYGLYRPSDPLLR